MLRSLLPLLICLQLTAQKGRIEPDRQYDLQHLRYELTLFPDQKVFQGQVTHFLLPLHDDPEELLFDAEGLQISRVTLNGLAVPFEYFDQPTRRGVSILPKAPLASDKVAEVCIEYSGKSPRAGLYFVSNPHLEASQQIWTQGEDMDNRHWLPLHDYPNDRCTVEAILSVPAPLEVRAGGLRLTEEPDPAWPGHLRSHWLLDQPMVTYLIAFAAGEWETVESTVDLPGRPPVPLATRIPKGRPRQEALIAHSELPAMMAFFSQYTGRPYPWPKYEQVFVSQFLYGGMENTTLTLNNENSLCTQAELLDRGKSLQDLVAHELVHHWFGNLITCRSWAHLWLNEGFATYFEALYRRERDGQDAFALALSLNRDECLANEGNEPMVENPWVAGDDGESHGEYERGGAFLAMLHGILGEERFRKVVQGYVERHAFSLVDSGDLASAIKDFSGLNLDPLFFDFVYQGGIPQLSLSGAWKEDKGQLELTLRQQPPAGRGLFSFPLDLLVGTASGLKSTRILVEKDTQFIRLEQAEAPQWWALDPAGWCLVRAKVEQPVEQWLAAVSQHPNPAERIEALGLLVANHGEIAPQALLSSLQDPVADVRAAAAQGFAYLQGYPAADWFAALREALADDSPAVRQAAMQSLSTWQPKRAMLKQVRRIQKEDQSQDTRLSALSCLLRWQPDYGKPLLRQELGKTGISRKQRQALVEMTLDRLGRQGMEELWPLTEQKSWNFAISWQIAARVNQEKEGAGDLLGAYLERWAKTPDRRGMILFLSLRSHNNAAVLAQLKEWAESHSDHPHAEEILEKLAEPASDEAGESNGTP